MTCTIYLLYIHYAVTTICACYSSTVCYGMLLLLLLQSGWTALLYACSNGHVEIVKFLISNKADISAADIVSDYVVCLFIIV